MIEIWNSNNNLKICHILSISLLQLFGLNLQPHDFQGVANDIPTLGRRLIGALTHPDNVLDLELKLKRNIRLI